MCASPAPQGRDRCRALHQQPSPGGFAATLSKPVHSGQLREATIDVVDLPPMRRCGLAITVPHAMPLVKQHAHYTTERQAGHGAVREICELLMKAKGTVDAQMAQYLG